MIYFIHLVWSVWLIWWCWGFGGFRLLGPKKTSAYFKSKHELSAIQANLMTGPYRFGTYWRLCLVFTRWLSFPCFAVSLVRSLVGRKGRYRDMFFLYIYLWFLDVFKWFVFYKVYWSTIRSILHFTVGQIWITLGSL